MKGSDLIQKRVQAQPLISVEKFQTEKWLMWREQASLKQWFVNVSSNSRGMIWNKRVLLFLSLLKVWWTIDFSPYHFIYPVWQGQLDTSTCRVSW
jgi:hypothetical protein